jgi:hypothetical protein
MVISQYVDRQGFLKNLSVVHIFGCLQTHEAAVLPQAENHFACLMEVTLLAAAWVEVGGCNRKVGCIILLQ